MMIVGSQGVKIDKLVTCLVDNFFAVIKIPFSHSASIICNVEILISSVSMHYFIFTELPKELQERGASTGVCGCQGH